MQFLAVFLEESPGLKEFSDLPREPVQHNGRTYSPFRRGQLRSIFFDWLVDAKRLVIGVELHIMPGEGLFEPIPVLPYVSYEGPFPRIWFFDQRDGQAPGIEAFECYYFLSQTAEWLVLLPLVEWLTEEQLRGLRQRPSR